VTQLLTRAERKSQRKRPSGCAVAMIVVGVLIVVAIAAGAVAWQLLFKAENPVAPGQTVIYTVHKGDSASTIAVELAKRGIVANALMFRIQAKRSKNGSLLKPGTYTLATGMPYEIVLSKLASGPDVVYYTVTIPEGFTARRVAARMAAQAHVSESEMLDLVLHGAPTFAAKYPFVNGAYGGSLEGYLFPKTYTIKKGTKPEAIVELMLHQFQVDTADLDLATAKKRGLGLSDVVTIASIIERETRLSREYRLVSSVIYNRLALPMRLQLDSTVFYGLPEGTKVLHSADIQNHTPWNTYRRDGLPLTPICNPGTEALKAAANPKKTPYLYYVLTSKDGSQTFTTNYADFLKAVKKYRTLFGY
jgi:UPF0755 protein